MSSTLESSSSKIFCLMIAKTLYTKLIVAYLLLPKYSVASAKSSKIMINLLISYHLFSVRFIFFSRFLSCQVERLGLINIVDAKISIRSLIFIKRFHIK
ncbi:hypothetical protein C1646_44494 [Rhizophagus diaphanus]|nr:hypothetical protein C1646_44494 [Rhizophagus diaphanus] [Rhizophagus sp. MUCL 43196]